MKHFVIRAIFLSVGALLIAGDTNRLYWGIVCLGAVLFETLDKR